IAAWEIAAGCKGYGAAWALNLGGMAGGLVRAPRRVFAAFVRGRGQRTTYGEELDVVLALTVGAARERFMRAAGATRRATLADVVLFLLALLVGFVVALVLFALIVPLVPVGLITHALRRRRSAARMTT
ncbi:MAG: hypothetical protein J0I07_05075, partial [Myxococcales bacterium]|nr:hypothetical protein [Myxococcales bacterium]